MSFLANREHEERPWGSFERFTLNELSTVKILRLHPGQAISLQRHAKRSEFWRILEGDGVAQVHDEMRPVVAGDEIEIPPETEHRLTAGEKGLAWLEVALGEFNEHDEVRIEDAYGRTSPSS